MPVYENMDLFHPTFNKKVQPFCRNSDPATSEAAAKARCIDPQNHHYWILDYHQTHKTSDGNAGWAAFQAGVVNTPESGRRASRTCREDFGWIELDIDEQGNCHTVTNVMTNRKGQRNRITPKGLDAFSKRIF